jgi:thiosulfate dehydrogenase
MSMLRGRGVRPGRWRARLPVTTLERLAAFMVLAPLAVACSRTPMQYTAGGARMTGPLIGATATMSAAWEFPKTPLTGGSLDDSPLSAEIKSGFRIFTDTPHEAPQLAPGGMSCSNCHMNAGQREKSLPLVGVSGMFPEYNRRSGRLFSLGDRITDCFLRSENTAGGPLSEADFPTPTSREVLAVSAYLTWLSRGSEVGRNPSWRGQNAIAAAALIPVDKLDSRKGEEIYRERCVSCHGLDGQGVAIGDKKAGPLWGPGSWNDGAGAARVYTLAGMIRFTMPYLDPGNMTDADAQQLAAFINSKPRPAFPFKDRDYRVENLPVDAVYYARR